MQGAMHKNSTTAGKLWSAGLSTICNCKNGEKLYFLFNFCWKEPFHMEEMKFLKKLDFSDKDLGQYKLFFVPSNHNRLVLAWSELATSKKLCINYTAMPSQTHTLKIQPMAY